ncbi:MAG: phosphoglucosamine mutase [Thermoanaerobaculia bacterium]|nr:phosphoglucosamine mutase [Thermoanaerobaculia bacterium]
MGRFGTDGMRAPFGTPPLDQATVTALGFELGTTLVARHGAGAEVVLGGDTRDSTPTLGEWLAAGLVAAGAVPRWFGVVPTGGLAFLVRHLGAAGAAVVSASHNPHPDNGIKLLDGNGFKWSPEAEAEIEAAIDRRLAVEPGAATGDRPYDLNADGAGRPAQDAIAAYLDHLAASLPGTRPLVGRRIALDVGHGAAHLVAGPLFERLGAEVTVLFAAPDGTNINAGCGSTHPEALAATVRAGGFDCGFAFDGDADRAVLVDETGAVRDGDALLFLWARDLLAAGHLVPPAIVATSMSNLGLERALGALGIGVQRSDVGDREVVKLLLQNGLTLGGEQSGHVVHLGLASTGDGLLTALQIAGILARADQPASATLAPFVRFPQVLVNVRVAVKKPFETLPEVAAAVAQVEAALGREGRLVLRYSGTEPLARVMIEGPDAAVVTSLAESVAAAIRSTLGSPA